jgi:hypothetical protein
VLVYGIPGMSNYYFLGDLNIAPSTTALISSVWVRADIDQAFEAIRRSPPQCLAVAATSSASTLTLILLRV